MAKVFRAIAIILGVLAFLMMAGPLGAPIPQLDGLIPVKELADADSQFIEVDGLQLYL